jgi:hypothetical protein
MDKASPRTLRDLARLREEVGREFDLAAVAAADVSGRAAGVEQASLLDERIGLAAHSTDRLLHSVLAADLGEQAVRACAAQATRVGAAVAHLHTVAIAAVRETTAENIAPQLAAAVEQVEQAVDGLYTAVAAVLPPAPGDTT